MKRSIGVRHQPSGSSGVGTDTVVKGLNGQRSRACGSIERLGECDAAAIEAAARNRGYTQLSHVLEIHGLCPRCSHG